MMGDLRGNGAAGRRFAGERYGKWAPAGPCFVMVTRSPEMRFTRKALVMAGKLLRGFEENEKSRLVLLPFRLLDGAPDRGRVRSLGGM
jgi:hypothetical protein